ncbi:MAG: hypothetical protein ACI9YB_001387 [Halioglobus sp.]|jgi:hypothetical protein
MFDDVIPTTPAIQISVRDPGLEASTGSKKKYEYLNQKGYLEIPGRGTLKLRVNLPDQEKTFTLDEIKTALMNGDVEKEDKWRKIADLTNAMVGQIFNNIAADCEGEFGDKTRITEKETRDTNKDVQLVDHDATDAVVSRKDTPDETEIVKNFNELVQKIGQIAGDVLSSAPGAGDGVTMKINQNQVGSTGVVDQEEQVAIERPFSSSLKVWNQLLRDGKGEDGGITRDFLTGLYNRVPDLSERVSDNNLLKAKKVQEDLNEATQGHQEKISQMEDEFMTLLTSGDLSLANGQDAPDGLALQRIIEMADKKIAEKRKLADAEDQDLAIMENQLVKLKELASSGLEDQISISLEGSSPIADDELDLRELANDLLKMKDLEENLFSMEGQLELKKLVDGDVRNFIAMKEEVDGGYEELLAEATTFEKDIEPLFAEVKKDIIIKTFGRHFGKIGPARQKMILDKVELLRADVDERLNKVSIDDEDGELPNTVVIYRGCLERAQERLKEFAEGTLATEYPHRASVLKEWEGLKEYIFTRPPEVAPIVPLLESLEGDVGTPPPTAEEEEV